MKNFLLIATMALYGTIAFAQLGSPVDTRLKCGTPSNALTTQRYRMTCSTAALAPEHSLLDCDLYATDTETKLEEKINLEVYKQTTKLGILENKEHTILVVVNKLDMSAQVELGTYVSIDCDTDREVGISISSPISK